MKPKAWLRIFLGAGLTICTAAVAQSRTMPLDKQHTRLGFALSTRWGQTLEGSFPRYDGVVNVLPDGRHQVTLHMYTADVEIGEHTRYAQWARGSAFFDAEKWPEVLFVSFPYDSAVLQTGGQIQGELVIRGIRRPETLAVTPEPCARPGIDCDVVLSGEVRRSDYDMDGFRLALNDTVQFLLRARVQAPEREPKP